MASRPFFLRRTPLLAETEDRLDAGCSCVICATCRALPSPQAGRAKQSRLRDAKTHEGVMKRPSVGAVLANRLRPRLRDLALEKSSNIELSLAQHRPVEGVAGN